MIFIQFLISIPQYPALQPQADTVKENKRIDTQHVTTPDKISDISHTSRIESLDLQAAMNDNQ